MEYETLGLVFAVVGLISVQIKLAVKQGNKEHLRLDNKINLLAKHLKIKNWRED